MSEPLQALEELTALYERRAYVVWNVALRTANEPAAAGAAARRAFLAQVAASDEGRLPFDAARLAIEEAGSADPPQTDDPVLAATARLAPPQRAALALTALADASSEGVASAFGIEPAAAQELRDRAYEQLGTQLAMPAADAQAAYEDLPWAEPPAELWQAVYPELHAAVTQQARAAVQTDQAAPRRRRRPLGSLRGVPRAAVLGVAVLGAAGVGWAATGGGSGSGGSDNAGGYADLGSGSGGSSFSEAGEASTADPLSPEELDRLRQEEIEDLKRYTQRKADKRLPKKERRRAAKKVDDLVKLAQERQRAAERRELAIRRALAREREARVRERNRQTPTSESDPAPTRSAPVEQEEPREPEPKPQPEDTQEDDSRTRDETEAECLYDADSGTYICPE